ncbi:glycine receptor subunit alpha-2-like isoform X2 [Mya arenaria]|uniref:glycine receptor subunit alpha-2-like isoform X2 n=1 Tax=Mya arenaria TaxID=6604 RepID=UPI0022E081B0|nr:glycine receptor subunit alpha-2-like isoform X2 [Mya arenaria]
MIPGFTSSLLLVVSEIVFSAFLNAESLSRQATLNSLLGLKEDGTSGNHDANRLKYDSSIAPDFELDVPTEVRVRILIQNIYSVTETSMEYSMDIFLRQKWEDKRLKYGNTSELPWLELDNKIMDSVWVPDTFFPNEKKARVHDVTVPNKMMHLYKNGTVLYSIRLSLTLSCSMQLHKYPMDVQICPIVLASYAYTTENVIYRWEGPHPVHLNHAEMPQFGAEVVDNAFTESCKESYGENQFACIQGFIQLNRKVGYYIVQVFVPSILIVVLSWVSFWVDHDAVPARISLGVLTVLTMTTQSSGALQSLPQAIDVWMFTCLIFVFVALIEYSYVNVVARGAQKGHSRKQDRPIELQPLTKERPESNKDNMKQGGPAGKSVGNIAARRVDKISRFLFPVAFVVFNIVFWTYYSFVPHPTNSS